MIFLTILSFNSYGESIENTISKVYTTTENLKRMKNDLTDLRNKSSQRVIDCIRSNCNNDKYQEYVNKDDQYDSLIQTIRDTLTKVKFLNQEMIFVMNMKNLEDKKFIIIYLKRDIDSLISSIKIQSVNDKSSKIYDDTYIMFNEKYVKEINKLQDSLIKLNFD